MFVRSRIFYVLLCVSIIIIAVEGFSSEQPYDVEPIEESLSDNSGQKDEIIKNDKLKTEAINANKADSIIAYAYTLEGIPYRWAGKTPQGFDCSGFIFHVFNKYGIDLPASSSVLYNEGVPILKDDLVKGDLVFFTGTDTNIKKVGHVGIISSSPGEKLQFIHSSSGGGGRGVTVNDLDHPHYQARYFGAKRLDLL